MWNSSNISVSPKAGQRQIADVIEANLADYYVEQGGKLPDSVRTIEDVSLGDTLIDIKTRDVNRKFSMPNLISVARLRKNKDTKIVYHFVDYEVSDNEVVVLNQTIVPIWEIDWSVLKIQNLGKGQLQLCGVKDYNKLPKYEGTQEEWFVRLELEMVNFYKKQITKFESLLEDLEV
jgi:hypothetical protein